MPHCSFAGVVDEIVVGDPGPKDVVEPEALAAPAAPAAAAAEARILGFDQKTANR